MPRPLAVGQIWVRKNPDGKVVSRYRVVAVNGNNATCDLLNSQGRPHGLKVFLPDNFLTRYESGPLPTEGEQ